MSRVVEFGLEDGGVVLVRVADDVAPQEWAPGSDQAHARPPHGSITTRGWGDSTVVERAQHTFEGAVEKVMPAVESVVERLRSAIDAPDEVTVEFGIELNAQAGAILAAAGTTASLSVSVTWRAGSLPRPVP